MKQIDYVIPEGTKDYEIFQKSKQITIRFIDELNQQGFLRKRFTREEEILTEIISDRINSEAKSIMKLEELFTSNKKESFFADVNKYDITLGDLMNYYMGLYTHQLLDIFELFRKYLVVVLDKETLELSKNPTLGEIFAKFESKKINHEFDEVIDKNLRNALGHGSYWWKNSKFHYTIDPNFQRTKILTLGELYVITRQMVLLTNGFTITAFSKIMEIKQKP